MMRKRMMRWFAQGVIVIALSLLFWYESHEHPSFLFPGLALLGFVLLFVASARLQFLAGGALVNLGFRLQDHLDDFGLRDEGTLAEHTPQDVFDHVMRQNALASSVRFLFPRTPRRPVVALVVCMDARLDTTELVGDTRKYYYVIRAAGSVLGAKEQEMLELAVLNGVRLVLHTTHTECAAERTAASTKGSGEFPELVAAVHARTESLKEFRTRPEIARRLASGELVIRNTRIDTATARMVVTD